VQKVDHVNNLNPEEVYVFLYKIYDSLSLKIQLYNYYISKLFTQNRVWYQKHDVDTWLQGRGPLIANSYKDRAFVRMLNWVYMVRCWMILTPGCLHASRLPIICHTKKKLTTWSHCSGMACLFELEFRYRSENRCFDESHKNQSNFGTKFKIQFFGKSKNRANFFIYCSIFYFIDRFLTVF
jgi:hypothetical protein